jgi:putative nucleotidyltransferase with HDIG domain
MSKQFSNYNVWFKRYVRQFYSNNPDIQANILLKEEHSFRVLENMKSLAGSLNLPENSIFIAKIIALFHDIGRFEQYTKYKTFSDSHSENHAKLGVNILKRHKLFNNLPQNFQKIIYKAIELHNHRFLPQNLDKKEKLFTRMIRDADKLDIWYVVTRFYENPAKHSKEAIGTHLCTDNSYQQLLPERILSKKNIDYNSIKSLNDLRLLQISWVYDINFLYTFKALDKNQYMNKIFKFLPNDPKINILKKQINTYMKEKIQLNPITLYERSF